jgi:hypothetical protein
MMAKKKNQRGKVRGQLGQPRLVRSAAPRSVKPIDVQELEPATEVVTERIYITTEPEVEIRKPATLAQALTEPAVAVLKPKTKVERIRSKPRRVA